MPSWNIKIRQANEANAEKAERVLSVRERDSLLKLVIGLAVKGYGYDAKASRNSQTREIADDLAGLGIPFDADTVRKYLSEAKQLLPAE